MSHSDEWARIAAGLSRIEDPRALLEGLFAFAPVGFQIYGADGRCLLVNKAFRDIFGSEPPPEYNILRDEIAEKNGMLPLVHRAFQGEIVQAPLVWYDPRELQQVKVTDGRRAAIEILFFPLFDRDNVVRHVALVFKDVTERETLEADLRQAQKLEAVGRLAGGVAHDFNNMMTVVQGYLHLLKSGDAPQKDCLEGIGEAAGRAVRLTQQLLAFSRQQIFQPRIVDPGAVIRGLETTLLRLIPADIACRISLPEGLGRILIDPTQLDQIVVNLAVNARDAMPQGGTLTIEAENVEQKNLPGRPHPEIPPGRYVLLSVRDSGVGMDAETRSKIFEPFFTTKGPGKGTGLGLSTVYGIVRQSQGHIRVDSVPGAGSSFHLYFPLQDGDPEAQAVPEPGPELRGSETILLAEDEALVRRLTRTMLERAGYSVRDAQDGKAALEIASGPEPIHLLLTDVVMPVLGGRELAEQMARLRPETKILFMSGYTEDVRSRPGGAFIAKPFSSESLLRKVRDVLGPPRV